MRLRLLLTPLLFLSILFPLPVPAQNPYMSYYQYLLNYDIFALLGCQPFASNAVLEGPVHSIDTLTIGANAIFRDVASTTVDHFLGDPATFLVDPVYNAPRVYYPGEATEIRQLAAQQNLFFDSEDGYYAHRLVLNSGNGWNLYRWPLGLPFNYGSAPYQTGSVMQDEVIFVDGYLELYGVFRGRGVIGARGHPDYDDFLGFHCIRLLDDVRYWFADPNTGAFNDTTGVHDDMLTIISESNITIGNTWANGRENRLQGADIIITAALIALGDLSRWNYWGSFSFEDMNEPAPYPTIWEWFTGSYSCPNPPDTDERGVIHLWGSLTQRRRGYTHRSNHGGTGYSWDHHYDDRFRDGIPVAGIKGRHNPEFNPEEVFFTGVAPRETALEVLQLHNDGGTYIDVDTAYTNTVFFTVDRSYSTSLIPGQNHDYLITFSPATIGQYTDTLTVELLYGQNLKVALTGECTNVGITEPSSTSITWNLSAFPNPFNDELRITLPASDQYDRTIEIVDVTGQLVLRKSLPASQRTYTWYPDHLSAGIYIVRLSGTGQAIDRKVVYLK